MTFRLFMAILAVVVLVCACTDAQVSDPSSVEYWLNLVDETMTCESVTCGAPEAEPNSSALEKWLGVVNTQFGELKVVYMEYLGYRNFLFFDKEEQANIVVSITLDTQLEEPVWEIDNFYPDDLFQKR